MKHSNCEPDAAAAAAAAAVVRTSKVYEKLGDDSDANDDDDDDDDARIPAPSDDVRTHEGHTSKSHATHLSNEE